MSSSSEQGPSKDVTPTCEEPTSSQADSELAESRAVPTVGTFHSFFSIIASGIHVIKSSFLFFSMTRTFLLFCFYEIQKQPSKTGILSLRIVKTTGTSTFENYKAKKYRFGMIPDKNGWSKNSREWVIATVPFQQQRWT